METAIAILAALLLLWRLLVWSPRERGPSEMQAIDNGKRKHLRD